MSAAVCTRYAVAPALRAISTSRLLFEDSGAPTTSTSSASRTSAFTAFWRFWVA